MSNETITNPPPDWSTLDKDLHCPLCEYNLRGLTESRCPECGFAFTWAELLDALKNKHPYLFEYGRGRNIKTLCKTWWRTSRPRRFWREVNPAQDVKVKRLILYWMIASSIIGLFAVSPLLQPLWKVARQTYEIRSQFSPMPGHPGMLSGSLRFAGVNVPQTEMDAEVPLPWKFDFWKQVWTEVGRGGGYGLGRAQMIGLSWAFVFLLWPWLTLLCLMIFRISMRQAKIRNVHLLRAVIYSCDFGLLLVTAFLAVCASDSNVADAWIMLSVAAVCAGITSYRLTIAFQRYLRVHLPFATVLASQLIAFLFVFVLLLQIADFTRRI